MREFVMNTRVRAAACAITSLAAPAVAGPADYVISPIIEAGEKEIDLKAGSAKARDGGRESSYSIGLGLGVNERWFTELYAIWKRQSGEGHGFDAWEWENRFQLTPTGRYPIDVGVLLEIERPKDRSEGYEIRWGPLFQSDLDTSLQANFNLLFEKHVRTAEAEKAELGYQWQLKYRWRPAFEFGVQGFGDVGPWNDWEPHSQQPHVAGPALFGRVRIAERQTLRYNAAMLFGLTDGAPRHTVRMQVEYEF
jgi:hypothetical protein